VVLDFSLSVGSSSSGGSSTGSPSQTATPGGTATYSLAIAPTNGTTFPLPVTLTVSGVPAESTVSITPAAWTLTSSNPWTWTLPANTPLTSNVQVSIQLPQSIALAQPPGVAGGKLAARLAPFSLALLQIPFAGRMRKAGKRLGRVLSVMLLLAVGLAASAGLSGCGFSSGYFGQAPVTYTIQVTVTSGALSHSTSFTLTDE